MDNLRVSRDLFPNPEGAAHPNSLSLHWQTRRASGAGPRTRKTMSLQIHPALRASGLALGGLVLLVLGSLAAVKGLSALAQAGMPAPPAPVPAAPATPNYRDPSVMMARARLVLRQTHGDWSRVSPADRRLLNGVTGGHGREMLRAMAKKQGEAAQTHQK